MGRFEYYYYIQLLLEVALHYPLYLYNTEKFVLSLNSLILSIEKSSIKHYK